MRYPWSWSFLMIAALTVLPACHPEVPDAPLVERKIALTDRFFDVQALGAERAVVVGYAGKILMTEDNGRSWTVQPSGTRRALYDVEFVNPDVGWVCGQDGVMLHTADGGQTWQRQPTGTSLYLFALSFLDDKRGWAVGDRATLLETTNGGATWALRKLAQSASLSAADAIASQDPVLYDVQLLDDQYGWVVGEFGKIFHTRDGGASFAEQQESLLGDGIFDVLDIPTFFGVRFLNRQEGLVAGLDGKIARTRDGGQTWHFDPMELEYPIIDPLYAPVTLADGRAWAIGAAGEIVRHEPGAPAWKRAKLGMEVVTWLRGIDFATPDNGWIVGGFGLILHTTDGGKTWLPSLG